MQGKIVSTTSSQPVRNHHLWRGASGSIYFQDSQGNRVCLINVGVGPVVGHVWTKNDGRPFEPFYGTIELSEVL